jgi:plastocyanin
MEGQAVNLSWDVSGAVSVEISPLAGLRSSNDHTSDSPSADTDYILTAKSSSNQTTSVTRHVTVTHRPVTVQAFRFDRHTISAGETVMLNWRTTDAKTVRLGSSPNEMITVKPTGSMRYEFPLAGTYRYFLQAEGKDGSTQQFTASIVVQLPTKLTAGAFLWEGNTGSSSRATVRVTGPFATQGTIIGQGGAPGGFPCIFQVVRPPAGGTATISAFDRAQCSWVEFEVAARGTVQVQIQWVATR